MGIKELTDLQEHLIQEAEQFAHAELEHDQTGHDWWHIQRVVQMAKRLARAEKADEFICTVAALLHDVADEKLNVSKQAGLDKVSDWLSKHDFKGADQEHIIEIISNLSYNAGKNPPMHTLEGQVVQDADRIDAIGAIAIARAFLYAGVKGNPIHDPQIPPRSEMTAEQYRQEKSTGINHFHEKLLKLNSLINTESAKQIAAERHSYMEQYVERFYREWSGEE
ncbi:HD domain-containing protein [Paenibacillus motobuensis]|uniref:HD domain-containing protein n=1 Tax=Paenibacillus motobuensis TaxID=295324 RepID=A0ABN0YGC1_9BACL